MSTPSQTAEDLSLLLKKIDHRGYKAYKELKGSWAFQNFDLFIDHVQGDPFAAPSRFRVRVPMKKAGFPPDTFRADPVNGVAPVGGNLVGSSGDNSGDSPSGNPGGNPGGKAQSKSREIGLRDFLTRRFGEACRSREGRGRGNTGSGKSGSGKAESGKAGSGKSGLIEIDMPGQEVIERSSCFVNDHFVEVRFVLGLPAFGRRIAGDIANDLLRRRVPGIVGASLFFKSLDSAALYRAVETAEDADVLRGALLGEDLVAFVADDAILPRRSGVDERPLPGEEAIPFTSPKELRVSFDLPNRGRISGMGIPHGITLIVGGGYHGKSTLLNAIEQGVYNHIPGDGREFVVSDPLAFKIRAEDGRRIEKTSITPFISNLPYGRDTDSFSSENASGSTSQAANIIEAVEAGASTLLIDEDTSATNFMIRDHRMQELVSKELEPITPFIDKVRHLFLEKMVSTLLVIGGSGDYFDVADLVIGMNAYVPRDVTKDARRIAEKYRSERAREGGDRFGSFVERAPIPSGIDPSRGRRDVKINIRGPRIIDFGTERIDLTAVEQLIHPGQARSIAAAMIIAGEYMDGRRSLREILDRIMVALDHDGLDVLSGPASGRYPGDLVRIRSLELAAALNRLRSFRVNQLSINRSSSIAHSSSASG